MKLPFARRSTSPASVPAKPAPLIYDANAVIATDSGLAVMVHGSGVCSIWRVSARFCVASGLSRRDALAWLAGYSYAVKYLETARAGEPGRVPPASP